MYVQIYLTQKYPTLPYRKNLSSRESRWPKLWLVGKGVKRVVKISEWATGKAPVTHSRFWLRLITIRPDETYIDKSGCIGMVKTENSEIPTMSHDVPTVSLRLLYDSWRCYYDATTMLLRQSHDITVGQSYCILGESGWIWMSRGWIVLSDDTPINPERPRMTTNTTTMPLGMTPIPLR